MQQENLIHKKNMEINDTRTNERYQKNMIVDKGSDGIDQISKIGEEKN